MQDQTLEKKVDYLTLLLEDWHESQLKIRVGTTVADLLLGGVIGYFLFQVLNHHLR